MDSTHKIVNCFQAAAVDCNIPVPPASLIEYHIGLSLEKVWEQIFVALNIPADQALLNKASVRYRDYFLEIDQTTQPLYEGVSAGIRQLDEAGYCLAIATGKARVGLTKALQETELAQYFVTSRCADEAYSKPHPKMLFDILAFCGCEPADALMVGDTHYDMEMAKNAGMASLAVAYGAHDEKILTPLATEGCAPTFEDALKILKR